MSTGRLKHSKTIHRIISFLKIQEIATMVLRKLHPKRRLPNGTLYRLKSLESYSIANEIFYSDTYDLLFEKIRIRTFMDLGCNVGYIACLLKEKCGEDVEGILIDADPHMVEDARWHLENNNLRSCHVEWGIVGGESVDGEQDFYVSRYNIASSALPFGKDFPLPIGRDVKRIKVPVVDVNKLWNKYFPDKRIDFLKIDIEGSEIEFLEHNFELFHKVDTVMIEWHKWCVDFRLLNKKVQDLNFKLRKVVKEDRICGLALYERI